MCSDKFISILDTYKGRDKVLKTLCYGSRLIGGSKKDEFSLKLKKFASELSSARAVIRLLDDFSTISYVIEYGLGKSEPDNVLAVLGLIGNIADIIYCPLDKICWLDSVDLIKIKNVQYYDTANTISWVISSYCTLLKNLWVLHLIRKHKRSLILDRNENDLECLNLEKRKKNEILTGLRMTLDLLHAIHYLPPGFLWSSKLQTWQIGLIASSSALISLYQMYIKK